MKIKNKNDIILLFIVMFIILSVIGVIIAIVLIWFPSKSYSDITSYTYRDFENEVVNRYQSQLERLLRKSNATLLVEKLDEEYLNKIGLKKSNTTQIIDYLNKKHLLSPVPSILDYSVSKNDDTGLYVYNFTYRTNGFKRKVYVLETEPYVYTISFEQDYAPTVAKKSIISESHDIRFEITLEENTMDSLKYNAKIINNGKNPVQFNFNNIASVELNLKDGKTLKLASVVASSEEDYKINTNSYINRELFFNVPLEQQGQISSIIFYDVLIEDVYENIKIDF